MRYVSSVLLAFLLFLPSPTHAETLQQIADRAKPGILGVAVCDLSTGITEGVNLDRKFPLQSVFKVFLAAALLDKVDAGQLSLDQHVVIKHSDVRDGSGPVADTGGGTFTVRQLIRAALINSDNTAADNLLPMAGGPMGVTIWLRQHQIDGIEVDRDERTLARENNGIPASLSPGENSDALRPKIPAAAQRAAFQAALAEDRDTATPQGAIDFLVALQNGKLLTPQSTHQLLTWMRECVTGPDRLKAGFPKKTILAHKTGTGPVRYGVALAINDIGLAVLPDGRTIAIATFLTAAPGTDESRDAFLAACAHAVAKP
jgi:beta-lactamase class A